MKKTIFEEMGGIYIRQGDYFIPCLTLTEEEQKELKEIDHAMLWYDLEHLLGEIQYGEIPELHIDLDYTVRPFEEVEEEYLSLFEKYSGTFCI